MLLTIAHDTRYHYGQAAWLVVQALRLWPAPSASQQVKSWRVEVNGKPLPSTGIDGFGNPVATHAIDRQVSDLHLSVRAHVRTLDKSGVHGDDAGGLPPMFFLKPTPLTQPSPGIIALADAAAGEGAALERLHRLANAVRDKVDYVSDTTHAETSAAEAFEAGLYRGGGGRAMMFETGRGNAETIALFARAGARATGGVSSNSLAVFVYEAMPNGTDFTIPKDR